MALDILNAKLVAENGLLSKIQIGGKTYEIKDVVARENVEGLALLMDALSAKVGNVAEGQNLAEKMLMMILNCKKLLRLYRKLTC